MELVLRSLLQPMFCILVRLLVFFNPIPHYFLLKCLFELLVDTKFLAILSWNCRVEQLVEFCDVCAIESENNCKDFVCSL